MRFAAWMATLLLSHEVAAQAPVAADPAVSLAAPLAWQASASLGLTRIDGAGDQPVASLGLRRELGEGFARLSGSWSEARRDERVALGQLAARTATLTAGGGWRAGRLSIDGWASVGDRSFKDVLVETIPPTTTNRRRARGTLVALGGGAALSVPLNERWVLSATGWAEWARLVTRASERNPDGDVTFRERLVETGVTGAAGASLEHGLRPGRAALFGSAMAAGATNAATLTQIDPGLPAGGPAARGGGGDIWAELAAGGAVRLSSRLTLVAAVTRTAGLEGGDYTQGALQLRLGF